MISNPGEAHLEQRAHAQGVCVYVCERREGTESSGPEEVKMPASEDRFLEGPSRHEVEFTVM